MQEFIDKFNDAKQTELDNRAKLQETIVLLLKHISKGVLLQHNMPSTDKFDDAKKELTFKEEKLKHSKNTRQILEKELEKRKEELHRIKDWTKRSLSNCSH